jgi:hypothetical protein
LLIRPQPETGESWPGYLLRIADLNHLNQGLAHFAKLLGITPAALIGSEPATVLGALGLSTTRSDLGRFAKKGTGNYPLRNSLRAHSARVCPQCLEEMSNKHIGKLGQNF